MKKLFLIGAFLLGIFSIKGAYAQDWRQACGQPCGQACDQACNQPCDSAVGECYCLYVHYQPCYYNTTKCIEEQVPYTRKCCRYVPQYYQVQRCRYVPQYYTETYCRQVPEYYDVQEYRCCKRNVCEQKCTYVPRYYWKHECRSNGNTGSCAPCGQ